MPQQIPSDTNAGPVVERVNQVIRLCEDCIKELSQQVHQPPHDRSENARLLYLAQRTLQDVKSQASYLKDDFLSRPIIKLLSGKRLTEAEFHFVASLEVMYWSAKLVGLSPATDFEVFDNFCCEISDEAFQINPNPVAPDGSATVRGPLIPPTRFPEQICISDLRPTQRDFFATHLPELFARFQT